MDLLAYQKTYCVAHYIVFRTNWDAQKLCIQASTGSDFEISGVFKSGESQFWLIRIRLPSLSDQCLYCFKVIIIFLRSNTHRLLLTVFTLALVSSNSGQVVLIFFAKGHGIFPSESHDAVKAFKTYVAVFIYANHDDHLYWKHWASHCRFRCSRFFDWSPTAETFLVGVLSN